MLPVQYIVVRKDLIGSKFIRKLNYFKCIEWSNGAIIAQACHAATKCIAAYYNDPNVQQYISGDNVNCMTKIILGVISYKKKI